MSIENENITKEKFALANKSEDSFRDDTLTGKPVGYFKDAMSRFKKNKASVVSAWLIIILMFFTIFGPYMRNYDLDKTNAKDAIRYNYLPPKIPLLEKIGFFDGTKSIQGRSKEFLETLPEGIVVKMYNERTIKGVILVDAKVDYYNYLAYTSSVKSGLNDVPYINMTADEYQRALERNAVLELISVKNSVYQVRVDIFQYSFGTTADDVYFWFGTSGNGEDLFTELWKGSRISVFMAIAITIVNLTIGVVVGSMVGYFGGKLDIVFERIVDVLSNMPFMAILTLLVLRFGSSFGIIMLAFVTTGWIGAYSSSRVQSYRYKNREFVLAARTYGAKDSRIIFRHILPNAIGTLITSFSLAIPNFIFAESSYSFLGIIRYSEATGVGELLSNGQIVMQQHGHLLLFPALYLSILMLSFNMFSNGLRDGFNPSLRGVEE